MVSSYTRLLERRYKDKFDDDGREFLFYIVDGTDRMSRLITDLLAFSRSGRTSAAPAENVDMNELVRAAVANLQTAIEESGALLTSDTLPTVVVRPEGLAQVVQNLLSNSLKYRRESPPRISIGFEERAADWVFVVRDNGLGFNPELAEKAFGIFKRLHGRDYPGTGIGLAICKRIVERNGGRIWAESEPGVGSCFYFTIPKAAAVQAQS